MKKEKFQALNKYINDQDLTGKQRTTLENFKLYLMENKPHLDRYYLNTLFSKAVDFAKVIKKPFEEATVEDFQIYYNKYIGNNLQLKSIESYENRIKVLYRFVFEESKQYDKYSEIEKVIKTTFKGKLIKQRKEINEKDKDNQELLNRIKKYLNEGIDRPIYENGKLVRKERVKLSEKQREPLNAYYRRLRSGVYCKMGIHGLSATFRTLFQFGDFIKKPFEEATENDFIEYFFKLEEEGKSLATINSYKHIIKGFYTHFLNKEELVKPIKAVKKAIRKKEEEMLSPSEIRNMIEKCEHPRDKAIIMVIYDGAMRQGEAINIQLKDIHSDDFGYKITISGKTGTRIVRLINAVPYLKDWLNYHPFKDDKEAYLFINLKTYGRKLKERGVDLVLKKSAKRSGLTKRVYPHLLRHSRLNQLAKEGFNERDLRIFAGWSKDSKMPDTYLHYGEEHVENKLLEHNGIVKDNEKAKILEEKERLKPMKCPRCEKINPADALYCNCGMILSSKEAVRVENMRERINDFTNTLTSEPINPNVDMSKGFMEAMFQQVLGNPKKVEEIKEILNNMD